VLNRLFTGLALTLLLTFGACDKSKKTEGSKEQPPVSTVDNNEIEGLAKQLVSVLASGNRNDFDEMTYVTKDQDWILQTHTKAKKDPQRAKKIITKAQANMMEAWLKIRKGLKERSVDYTSLKYSGLDVSACRNLTNTDHKRGNFHCDALYVNATSNNGPVSFKVDHAVKASRGWIVSDDVRLSRTTTPPPQAKKTRTPPPQAKTTTPPPQAKTNTEIPAAKPSAGGEVVFNPLKPPVGYANCHHNHCHLVGGGVESYKQVMDKMGATKLVEPPKPPAPADVAGPPGDATRTASGLAYKLLAAGSSDRKPTLESTVVAHLSSWSTDGKSLQSTSSRGRPATIPLGRVFKGLQEAFMLMAVGSEYRFWIPGELTRRPERGMVVFDIQLLQSREAQPTP
jgi:hypothetical protein